jgi:putative nucleotidyltransferase with HDIG domain
MARSTTESIPGPPAATPQCETENYRESSYAGRLEYLFRRSLSRGEVHPLLHVLKGHYGVEDGIAGLQPTPATPASAGAMPQARIGVDDLRRRVCALPSLPQAVREAAALLQKEGASVTAVAERIERDPALTLRTLRAANTAFYGAPGRVATLRTAIGVLGLRTVAALLTTAAVSAQFTDLGRCPDFHFKEFWRNALTAALVARGLAQRAGLDGEVAFTAGLLHDIGALVLATQFPAENGIALRFAREHDLPVLHVERAVLGVDHCVAGATLARHWRLPEPFALAVALHHEPPPHPTEKPTLAELVNVADALAHGIQAQSGPRDVVPPVAVATWERVGVLAPDCLEILRSTACGVEALCEALSL